MNTLLHAAVGTNGRARTMSRGLLSKYGRFLVEELKPFIDATYRTTGGRVYWCWRSSLGGLASLILGLWFPQTFTRIAALSPSIWWDDCVVLKMVDELDEPPRSSRIWLDTGTREEGWDRVGGLRDHLVWNGWRLYGELQYMEIPDAEHKEETWVQRFEAVLRFLYPPVPPPLKPRSRKPPVAMGGIIPPETNGKSDSGNSGEDDERARAVMHQRNRDPLAGRSEENTRGPGRTNEGNLIAATSASLVTSQSA